MQHENLLSYLTKQNKKVIKHGSIFISLKQTTSEKQDHVNSQKLGMRQTKK